MEGSQLPIVHRALSVMAADPQSPLDRDERYAVLCWLQGLDSNVLILIPDDLLDKLAAYVGAKAPELADELWAHCTGDARTPQPHARFDSPLETYFSLEWQQQALDLVYPLSPQHPIKDGRYRLDFAFPPLQVGIELDGYTYHSDREAFTRDRQRQREIEAQGWRVLRFSGDELRKDLGKCVQEAAHFLSIQQQRQRGENPFYEL